MSPTNTHLDACAIDAVDPAKVIQALDRLPDGSEIAIAADLFKLLGDPTRLRILYALAETGELCVCDLSAVVGSPDTSVSHALRLLRMAGVVRARKDGRMSFYAIDHPQVRPVLQLLAGHVRPESPR